MVIGSINGRAYAPTMCRGLFKSNCTEVLSKFKFSNMAPCGLVGGGWSCPSNANMKFLSMSPLGGSTLITCDGKVLDATGIIFQSITANANEKET